MTPRHSSLSRRAALRGLFGLGASALPVLPTLAESPPAISGPKPKAAATKAKPRWLTLPPTPDLPKPTASGHLDVKGARLYWAQFGSGSPVLLLHGGLANSNYWGHQVEALAGAHQVTVMDTRGHGRSSFTSPDFSYRLFADDTVALLDHLKIEMAAIAGWSDGAITGLILAMKHPTRVKRLFAFGANVTLDGLKSPGAGGPFAVYKRRCKGEYAKLSPNPDRWSQLVGRLGVMWRREPNLSRRDLASIAAPTVIADGEHDEIIKRGHTEQMAKSILGARLIILPEVSHFAMLQNPAQFNAALVEFLA